MYSTRDCIKFIALGLLYAVGFRLLWLASTQVETIPNTVSWYLPAGFRLTFYLLSPFRSWPFIYVISRTSHVWLFGDEWVDINPNYVAQSVLWYVSHFLLVPGLLMGAVWYFRKHFAAPFFHTTRSTVSVLFMSLLTSLGLGIIFLGRKALDNPGFISALEEKLFSFLLGDLIGILAVLPITMITCYLLKNPSKRLLFDCSKVLISWVSILVGIVIVSDLTIQLDYYMKMLTIIPIIFFSYKFGWAGACISVFSLCLATYTMALFIEGAPIEDQFYIISLSLCSLFLGAAKSESQAFSNKVKVKNTTLEKKNRMLEELAEMNRRLANRIIKSQEEDRLRLSRELHDDFGQKITEIKLKAAIARRENIDASNSFSEIISKADELYKSLKSSIGNLRPTAIDGVNFVDSLKSGELDNLCFDAGIELEIKVEGNMPALNDNEKIALYRVAQESINNSIKHSLASQINISIISEADTMCLRIADNGVGFNSLKESYGLGILGMEERAQAISADLSISTSTEGTIVEVSLVRKNPT